jgi:hypothetical protein
MWPDFLILIIDFEAHYNLQTFPIMIMVPFLESKHFSDLNGALATGCKTPGL